MPKNEIIEAIKNSIVREYNIKYDTILTTVSLYEELITDIIGNIYISNDNKVKYINMLQEYLEQNNRQYTNSNYSNIHDKCDSIEIEIEHNINNYKNNKQSNFKYVFNFSLIPAIITIISIYLSLMINQSKDIEIKNIDIIILILFSITLLKEIIEWFNDKK